MFLLDICKSLSAPLGNLQQIKIVSLKKKIACFHIEQLQWETRTERFMNISLNIINSWLF